MKCENHEIAHSSTHETHVLIAKHVILCKWVRSPSLIPTLFSSHWGCGYEKSLRIYRRVAFAIYGYWNECRSLQSLTLMTLYVFDYPDDSHIRTNLLATKVSRYARFDCSVYSVLILQCVFWCQLMRPFRFGAISVCGRFGLWPFRFVVVSVCGYFGLWPFRLWLYHHKKS